MSARAQGTPAATPAAGPIDLDAAAAYCTEKGGTVVTRQPMLGANLDPASRIVLGGAVQFCDFQGKAGDSSRISLSLETLYSEQPTLAALAYLTKPPVPKDATGANPSTLYCIHLGGAYNFGGNLAGGGWVATDPSADQNVANYCVFADGSMIDAWGITYHANDIVRGVDLTPILRYHATDYPKAWG
jgi:putative hemolysin